MNPADTIPIGHTQQRRLSSASSKHHHHHARSEGAGSLPGGVDEWDVTELPEQRRQTAKEEGMAEEEAENGTLGFGESTCTPGEG